MMITTTTTTTPLLLLLLLTSQTNAFQGNNYISYTATRFDTKTITKLFISNANTNNNGSSSSSNSNSNNNNARSSNSNEDEYETETKLLIQRKQLRQQQSQSGIDIPFPPQAKVVPKEETMMSSSSSNAQISSVVFDITLNISSDLQDIVLRETGGGINNNNNAQQRRLSLGNLQIYSYTNNESDSSRNVVLSQEAFRQLNEILEDHYSSSSTTSISSAIVIESVSSDSSTGLIPGDVILGTSATMGTKIWPKSTLQGIVSAVSSRQIMSQDMTFRVQRYGWTDTRLMQAQEVAEEFDVMLFKPLGIQVKDDIGPDGSSIVIVTSTSSDVQAARQVSVGDRVVAVDNVLGSEMKPVRTVEGLVSSVTSRLPSQPVKLRFQRMVQVEAFDTDVTTVNSNPISGAAIASSHVSGTNANRLLLNRCRRVLSKYLSTSSNDSGTTNTLPIQAANKVLQALSKANARIDARTLNLVLASYLRCNDADNALAAFEMVSGLRADGASGDINLPANKSLYNLTVSREALDLRVCTQVLQAHAMHGDYKSAGRALLAMQGKCGVFSPFVDTLPAADWGVAFDTDTVCQNIVLNAACVHVIASHGKDLTPAITYFDTITTPDIATYNTYMNMFASLNKVNDAYTLYYRIQQDPTLNANYVTYTTLIKALVTSSSFNKATNYSENVEEAMSLLQEMINMGRTPDIVTYNTLIEAWCNCDKWYEAKKLAADMEARGVSPNAVTYGLLMNGLLNANKPSPCLTLFEIARADLETASVTETLELYTTAITAAGRLGDYERAMELYDRMLSTNRISPNIKTFSALVQVCLKTNNTNAAIRFLELMNLPQNNNGAQMDRFAVVLAIRAYCQDGQVAKARQLLNKDIFGGHGYKRLLFGKDVMQAYDSILEAALRKLDYKIAGEVLSDMLVKNNFIPSKWTFQSILRGLELQGSSKKYKNTSQMREGNDETSLSAKFEFLLGLMDVLAKRNLSIDDSTYCSILFTAAQLNGAPRRLGSLIPKARMHKDPSSQSLSNVKNGIVSNVITWKELLQNDIDFRETRADDIQLPPLKVRLSNKKFKNRKAMVNYDNFVSDRTISAAERAVYIRPRRMNLKKKKEVAATV